MITTTLVGRVQTVLGAVGPESLGPTSSHEHILSDMSAYYLEPESPADRERVHEPLSLANLAWARAHRFCNLDNMRLSDRDLAVNEVLRFRQAR